MLHNVVTFLHYISILMIFISASSCPLVPKDYVERTDRPGLSLYEWDDLRTLKYSETKAFYRKFRNLTGKEINPGKYRVRPWWISKYRSGEICWILFEGYEGLDNPDRSRARIHCFDKNWDYVCSSDVFPTGYQSPLHEAMVLHEPALEMDVIVVHTVRTYQWYVILDHRVALIRMGDAEGNPVQNSYASRGPSIGPHIPKRTAREWRESLNSENPYEVLETLVWLSGLHLTSDSLRVPHVSQESVEDSMLFEAVRDSPEVKQKLLELRDSPNIWIRQAAELAIAHEHDRIRETDIRMFPPLPRSSSK